jgi:hypothetical protein
MLKITYSAALRLQVAHLSIHVNPNSKSWIVRGTSAGTRMPLTHLKGIRRRRRIRLENAQSVI